MRSPLYVLLLCALTFLLLSLALLLWGCSASHQTPLSLPVREQCLQSQDRPPDPLPVVGAEPCPYALCLDRANAVNLGVTVSQYVTWIRQAWLRCGPLPDTSHAAESPPSVDAGAAASSPTNVRDAGAHTEP